MLERLNDDQLHSNEVATLLAINPDSKFYGCCILFRAHAVLSAKSCRLEQRGFELLEKWKLDLNSLTNHLDEHLFGELRGDDGIEFMNAMSAIMLDVLKLREVVHAWVAV